MGKIKLAVIGCGAIATTIHLPVAALSDQLDVTVVVDKFLPRAQEIADKYGVPSAVDDYRAIIGKVDAAIVALPNYLHAPVTIDLLRHGIHVLVEKPMALKRSDCDEMIKEAINARVVLAVGLASRFFESSQFVKQVFENAWLGNIVSFDFRQGSIFSWPVASDFMFRKETAGGGVLVDIGTHILDLLLWWLGDYRSVTYYDDAIGGVEADCEIHLQLQRGVSGVVELSRTRNLRNTYIIHGERGIVEVEAGFDPLIRLKIKNTDFVLSGSVMRGTASDKSGRDIFLRQFEDFGDAILSRREPFVPGQEGKRVAELIEACYASRQPLPQPWLFPEIPVHGELEGVST